MLRLLKADYDKMCKRNEKVTKKMAVLENPDDE